MTWSKVRREPLPAVKQAPWGLSLGEHPLTLFSPMLTILVILLVTTWRAQVMWGPLRDEGCCVLTICPGTGAGPVTLLPPSFSPSVMSNSTASQTPATVKCFLGLLFFMVTWCINTSSMASFLSMKAYPFLTGTILLVLKSYKAMLSPQQAP